MQEEEMVFRLLRNIMSGLSSQINRYCEPFGITGVQGLVLMEIAANEQEMMISELAKQLMMSNSNLSAIAKRLEQHDLLERKRSKQDERIVILSLTKKARECMEDMHKCSLQEPFLTRLSKEQKHQIIESLIILGQAVAGGIINEKQK